MKDPRIEKMYKADVRNAWILIAVLWAVILFVLTMTWPFIPVTGIKVVVAFGAAGILIFNTAAVLAMIRHYAEDKELIYSMDIKFLDMQKKGE